MAGRQNGGEDNQKSAHENEHSHAHSLACPACGATARRRAARFCQTCGRDFAVDAAYMPADALRASYHSQLSRHTHGVKHKQLPRLPHSSPARRDLRAPFTPSQNSISALALASVAYALIPFLGILFCPAAIMFGGWGMARSVRLPGMDGRRASFFSVCAGLLILVIQLLLWWMLSRVPVWAVS